LKERRIYSLDRHKPKPAFHFHVNLFAKVINTQRASKKTLELQWATAPFVGLAHLRGSRKKRDRGLARVTTRLSGTIAVEDKSRTSLICREHPLLRTQPNRSHAVPRAILSEEHIHPAIREDIAASHADIVTEVTDAVAQHKIVVVGMAQNPAPRRARKLLDDAGLAYKYLEYGNYFNTWRRRNALKMWTGWPTFPMIFIDGVFIGGADNLQRMMERGELKPASGERK
jgi:glutaredoxin-related protein